MCNYYWKFKQNCSELMAQFQHQLSSNNKWKFGWEQEKTLQLFKNTFHGTVMLHHLNFNKLFFMNYDTSYISLGVELYWGQYGNHLVIGFASSALNNCKKRYNLTEKELVSIVFACNKFRTYVLAYPITVKSDHKPISFLKRCMLSHRRLTRSY